MPGYLLHAGAVVQCTHGITVQPTTTDPKVKVGGQPIVNQSSVYSPCPQGCAPSWVSAATRVRAGGVPVVLRDSQATCGLRVVSQQARVRGE